MISVCRVDESMDFGGQNVIQLIVYNGRNIENPVSCSSCTKNKICHSYAVYNLCT